jgi:hypothetical protein
MFEKYYTLSNFLMITLPFRELLSATFSYLFNSILMLKKHDNKKAKPPCFKVTRLFFVSVLIKLFVSVHRVQGSGVRSFFQ